jgi:hypothetical protein
MRPSPRIARVGGIVSGVLASLLIASSAVGHECVNASKPDQAAGAQVVIGPDGSIEWATPGLMHRVQQGLVNPEDGSGFHGIAAFDIDGDGVGDISTWMGVGSDGEIPMQAQLNGSACRGITNIEVYFSECLGN